jgi:hypothetical protein
MMTLYHGSHVAVTSPLVSAGRRYLDFGQGFYLTSLRRQAEKWASIVASRKGRRAEGVLNVYSFNDTLAVEEGVRFKRFDTYDREWLDYVVACRGGKDASLEYDVVEGGVANDNVIDTVEDYEKGIITAEQALGLLRYKEVNHQICILNQMVVDRYLVFVESITMPLEG